MARVVEANRAELETWLVREGGAVAGKAAFEVDLVLGELWEAAALPTNRELRIAVDVPIDQLLDEYRAGCTGSWWRRSTWTRSPGVC